MNHLKSLPVLSVLATAVLAHTATAQGISDPYAPAPAPAPPAVVATATAAPAPSAPPTATATTTVNVATAAPIAHDTPAVQDQASGWSKPVGTRLLQGIRIGYNYISNFEKPTREGGMSLKDELGLKTPHTMILGYEAMYRIVSHSWLNVIVVGNVSVAGLEQSKFIPTASGLIGAELSQSFQVGVGVNLTPDPQAPSHMIAAAGWTPRVGSINVPVHFFFVPDTEGNHRTGTTVGVSW